MLQGGLIFICGSRESLMEVSGRRHNADDVVATVLAVEPTKFVYRGRYGAWHMTSFVMCVINDDVSWQLLKWEGWHAAALVQQTIGVWGHFPRWSQVPFIDLSLLVLW